MLETLKKWLESLPFLLYTFQVWMYGLLIMLESLPLLLYTREFIGLYRAKKSPSTFLSASI